MPVKPTFHGRQDQADQFVQLFRKPSASLGIVFGRRRIGKSAFVKHCARTYADHFLQFEGMAPREDIGMKEQLREFAAQLSAQTSLPQVSLESWKQAFQMLAHALPAKGKTVVLLDEISWMAIGDKDFAGHLKIAWDNLFSARPGLVVILCGSVSSWIETNILKSAGFVGRCSRVFDMPPMPLPDCIPFWRGKASRVSTLDKIRTLSVTGGVPRYLEEIDPSQTAEQNIHRLCFDPGGLLFREFDDLFSSVFDRRSDRYREICRALSGPSKTVSELAEMLKVGRGGIMTEALHELQAAGFISTDVPFSPLGSEERRSARYRLSDNYTRFYLRYVEPEKKRIAGGLFKKLSLESLPGWESIMGLQFENLVLGNRDALLKQIGLGGAAVTHASPYFQKKTQRTEACQIDLLLRTRKLLYIVEIKLRKLVTKDIGAEVEEKIRRLKLPKGTPYRTVLVYHGELEKGIEDDEYFDHIVPFERLFESA